MKILQNLKKNFVKILQDLALVRTLCSKKSNKNLSRSYQDLTSSGKVKPLVKTRAAYGNFWKQKKRVKKCENI